MDTKVAVAFAIGLISFAISFVGVVEGITAAKACEATGRNPEAYSKIRTTMIIGIALTETEAIYSLVLAILLIFAF